VRAFGKLRALTKAISATDYLVGYGEGTLVEVPGTQPAARLDEGGKRAHEITAILDRVRQDDKGLDVAALDAAERFMIAALCFHAARRCEKGRDFVSMDELDYMHDMSRNVPHAVARRIARLESLAGRALFPRGDGAALLASLCNWGATEQAICAEQGYVPVLLIEGRRRVVYEPQTVLSGEQQMPVPMGLEGELAIAHVLQSATLGPNPLGHEAIVMFPDPSDAGARCAYGIVAGVPFRARATWDGRAFALQDTVLLPFALRVWSGTDLDARYPESGAFTDKMRQTFAGGQALECKVVQGTPLDDTDRDRATDLARYLAKRIAATNPTKNRKGDQLGIVGWEVGFHAAYDPSGTNNPAHAMGGVQHHMRAPFGQGGNARVWLRCGEPYAISDLSRFAGFVRTMEGLVLDATPAPATILRAG
jgi:hypothetical protein